MWNYSINNNPLTDYTIGIDIEKNGTKDGTKAVANL
jgi:hypothetical protein